MGDIMAIGENESVGDIISIESALQSFRAGFHQIGDAILRRNRKDSCGFGLEIWRKFAAVEKFEHIFEGLVVDSHNRESIGSGFASVGIEEIGKERNASFEDPFVCGDDLVVDRFDKVRCAKI